MRECSVLIIGGGLAGMSAAYHLTKAGVRDVVVVERMSGDAYGHYHRTCGEAISERALRESGAPRDCIVRDVRGIRISNGGVDIDIPVKGHIIDRERLLEDLRKGTDAVVVRDSIIAVYRTPEGFRAVSGREEYHCRHLVGADGVFSVVRKAFFGYGPQVRFAAVNNIVEGDSDTDVLRFEISSKYPGAYRWDFPSKDGRRSIGYENGMDDVSPVVEKGIRFIAAGREGPVTNGRCCIIGDAALLPNPLCYGGIGVALQSGRRAAECIANDDLRPYERWLQKNIMFDPHFLKALETYRGFTEEEMADAMKPFRNGYSVPRGAYAILRRPKWANVYMAVWVAFGRGW
ncbi:MAG: NAD(P)/FAD-dependent oxidoreductase [Thermoplasmata archaeon]|nr:NAD(P)/FAD-dependent oxidoreductase [Thermoplasmata archaeon]